MDKKSGVDRRSFLLGSAAAVAQLGAMSAPALAQPERAARVSTSFRVSPEPWVEPVKGVELNPWIVISPDNKVMVRVNQADLGQGVLTSNPMMICEELECDWRKVYSVYADANRHFRENNLYERLWTGSSSSVRNGRELYQKAGANARERLRLAAAEHWKAPVSEIEARQGFLIHSPTRRRVSYGRVAERAQAIKLDYQPVIKRPDQFSTIIGKKVRRFDTELKVYGLARYGIDIQLPGMLYAAIRQSPGYGGRLAGYDFDAIKNRKGVVGAYALVVTNVSDTPDAGGVAVVADSWWRAKTALDLLPVRWESEASAEVSSQRQSALYLEKINTPGQIAAESGDVDSGLRGPGKLVEAIYEAPHLAHATMEPMNCTAQVTADRVDIWAPTQSPEDAAQIAAKLTGLPLDKIFVRTTFIGGGFGRRYSQDYVAQAVALAKQLNGKPVKLLWSREEDISRDNNFHPSGSALFRAVLDTDGTPKAGLIRKAAHVYRRPAQLGPHKANIDPRNVRTLNTIPYAFSSLRVESHDLKSPIALSDFRGTGTIWNSFFLESFVDECAHASGQDPYEYRRKLLVAAPDSNFEGSTKAIWLRVLDTAAKNAGWGKPLAKGSGRGIAIEDRRNIPARSTTPAAVVATVNVSKKGQVVVDRIDVAFDRGHALINPNAVERDLRGQIAWAMSFCLHQEITFDEGAAKQSNFHDYPVVRMAEYPKRINIEFVSSERWTFGVGEELVPQIAPAICNAIFAATGKRIRSLPLKNHDLSWA